MTWLRRRGWGTEDHIQADIVEALRIAAPKVLVFAVPNGANLSKAARGKLFGGLGALAGVADLIVMWRDKLEVRVAFLEVKAPGKYPSPEQRGFRERAIAVGASWACVRSVDDALGELRGWGAPLRIKREAA